jgi:2Fe-2S ferredoxin
VAQVKRRMAKITYIEHDGTEHIVDVRPGMSLMEGALWNNVPGIFADCGGDGGCATCQVYVDDAWRSRLAVPSSAERSTLRFAYKGSGEQPALLLYQGDRRARRIGLADAGTTVLMRGRTSNKPEGRLASFAVER